METKKKQSPDHIGLVRNDSWLEPFEAAIRGRHDHAVWKINQLTKNGKKTLSLVLVMGGPGVRRQGPLSVWGFD